MSGSVADMPLLGERIALELANTVYAVRSQQTEGLPSPARLTDWLHLMGLRVDSSTAEDLQHARTLRAAIRTIASALIDHLPPSADAVAVLNGYAATPARWPELMVEPVPHVVPRSDGRAVDTALALIAADAVNLFGGPDRTSLRACGGPGCILYFVGSGRREWCTKGCGNRARAARHYAKTRQP